MLSTYSENFQRRRDVEQFAIDNLDSKLMRAIPSQSLYGEAELHCQGYTGEGKPPADVIIACRVTVTDKGRMRRSFTLNGRRIAAHKIALHLGSLGV